MSYVKKKLNDLITKILTYLPGGELRRCHNLSWMSTSCIKELNHRGKCEDAWRSTWKKDHSL